MATKKRQQKLSDEKQGGRKKQRNMEKENVEEHQITTPISGDESLMKQLDNVFMVKHPSEVLTFWRHAVKLNAKNPLDAFSELDSLSLAGPFLCIANERKKAKDDSESLFLNSRFATDLPEMETVLVHRGGRFCYWRDVPDEMPHSLVHVAGGDGEQHFPTVTICGERDLFAALQYLLHQQQQLTETKTKKQSNAASSSGTKSEQLAHLFPYNYDMTKYGPDYLQMLKKRRAKWAIGMPFHGIGIKVPINDKGIGYRPVSDDKRENAQLKRNIETMGTTDSEEKKAELKEKFHQMYAWIQFANDEMDFGMGLEFGHDLFMSNYACFDGMAKTVLMTSYEVLGRKQFASILEKHMEVRRRNMNDGTN